MSDNSKELKEWLVNNSSGVYRKCATAANYIGELEADNEILKDKVDKLNDLCREFASMGRVSINQNEALKGLCESYSDIANQRHLTTNKSKG